MKETNESRRSFIAKTGALGATLTVPVGSVVGASKREEGIVQSVRTFDDPVTPDHVRENQRKALQKFEKLGGNAPEETGFGTPFEDADNLVAHVSMFDAEKGFREFFGFGSSPKDTKEVQKEAARFISEIAGTQRVEPATSSGATATSSQDVSTESASWNTLSDSRWVHYRDNWGKLEVPYKWRKVSQDGDSSIRVFGLKTEVRTIPGTIAYGSCYMNDRHWFEHKSVDSDFNYIESYKPDGMTYGSTTTSVNLGWDTAYWSWSYTNPNVSIEQNGDTTTGNLHWDVPDNDGDYISGEARNSTLTWEPGSQWKFDQSNCRGTVELVRNEARCQFNEDGCYANYTNSFKDGIYLSYNTGDPRLC